MELLVLILDFLESKKRFIRLLLIIFFVGSIILLFQPMMLVLTKVNEFSSEIFQQPLQLLLVLAITLGIYLIIMLIWGNNISNIVNKFYTKKYITKVMAKIIKIVGETGAGKDTLASAIVYILRTYFVKDIKDQRKILKSILYQLDHKLLKKYFEGNYTKYVSGDHDYIEKLIFKFLQNNNPIKKRYRKLWNFETMLQNYQEEELLKRYGWYQNYKTNHLIEIIIKYIELIVRSKVKNFVFSNQPYMETELIPAKVYSTNYLKLAHPSKIVKEVLYKERICWPWMNYSIAYETESDALWNNMDKDITKYIKEHGIRNTRAFIRHFQGENFYMIQVGQNAERVNKQLRELDHAIMQIAGRTEDPGWPKVRFLLMLVKGIIYGFYGLIYLITPLAVRIRHLIAKLSNFMQKLKDYGVIKIDIIISNNQRQGELRAVELKKITKGKDILIKYATKLVFPTKASRGRYDSYYLRSISDTLKVKSHMNMLEAPSWKKDLSFTKEQAIIINHPVTNKMYEISDKEILDKHFEEIKK
ncbi:hypothetical protein LJC17_01435 [Acholeplasma sp. OttesenSCG-928-E16]|nr:hypothetical protein [Acholeplasma sp. OttesenSCG-928-E16]